MRNELLTLVAGYPRLPVWRDPAFEKSPIIALLTDEFPDAINRALPAAMERYKVRGSAGQGGWTHTPWVALLDPAVTTSVEEGFYVAYLLSLGGERLYVSLNQGCTALKSSVGIRGARDELRRRSDIMWSRVSSRAARLSRIKMDLNVKPSVWRGKLYEAGLVAGVVYDTANFPTEEVIIADLREALTLYGLLSQAGGWEADDDILRDAMADSAASSLEQAKRYRLHRAIERQTSHSKIVKKKLGTRCMGCSFELREQYGSIAVGLIDAHHLLPLSKLADNEVIRFDPEKDFAVLCPNCHRIIHRMDESNDIDGLRKLVMSGVLAKVRSS